VVDAYALRLLGYRTLAKARRGIEATEQSILKLFGSEAAQGALHFLEALGPDALDPDRRGARRPLHSRRYTASWCDRYLRSFSGTIAGGTSQIQRNIIAERVLGSPADRCDPVDLHELVGVAQHGDAQQRAGRAGGE
jgi:alkylation response protein AidB-like acyl-CoA dehydrogenase